MGKSTIRLMLVDDHQMLREGLRMLIESEEDMKVMAEAGSGEDALAMLKELTPDLVIVDLGLPGMGGLQAIEEMRSTNLACKIIVLSMHNDPEIVAQAIKAGSDGFVPKSTAHSHLLEAIRAVYSGQQYLHPLAVKAVFDEFSERKDKAFWLRRLSKREFEVLEFSAKGHTSRQIGEVLHLSPKTIETYRTRAMEKLHLENRAELIEFALQSGLLDAN